MAELVDAPDSKSGSPKGECRFEPDLRYLQNSCKTAQHAERRKARPSYRASSYSNGHTNRLGQHTFHRREKDGKSDQQAERTSYPARLRSGRAPGRQVVRKRRRTVRNHRSGSRYGRRVLGVGLPNVGLLTVSGGASDDVVKEAGVGRAKGLVAAVDSEVENVFVALSARKLNPDRHIVARASSDESAAKLEIMGADRTLSPYAVGGRRLASLAAHPLIVDFLDLVTRVEGDQVSPGRVKRSQGFLYRRSDYRGPPHWGENRGHNPCHPQQGRHLRQCPLGRRPPARRRYPRRVLCTRRGIAHLGQLLLGKEPW